MQATLIYNGSAGGAENYSSQDIKDALTDAGYNVHYHLTHNEKDVASVLADAEGLVVIAGGDGTVRTVMLHYMQQHDLQQHDPQQHDIQQRDLQQRKTLAEQADTEQDNHQHLTHPPRLSIIPLGTANNISRALGIKGNLDSMLTGLEQPQTCRFDVGCLAAPWGKDYFLEGFGCGILADALARYDPKQGKSIWRAANIFTDIVQDYQSKSICANLDGRDLSGDVVMLAALNTTSIGPRLKLAPYANHNDGQLEVVCIYQHEQANFLHYLTNMVSQDLPDLPGVEILRGKQLELIWQGCALHVDAEVRPAAAFQFDSSAHYTLTVSVLEGALEFWLPT